jgi:hypothetical protein
MSEPATSAVTKNWLIGIMTTVLMAGGAGWMTNVHSQVSQIKGEQSKDRDSAQEIKRDLEVSKERLRRVEEDTKEIREEQKEQSRKLDELLRRVR